MKKMDSEQICQQKHGIQGYQAVDLGLPSGLKWADRNVGAESSEAFGDYFAWGETAPRGENWPTEAPYDWAHAPFNGGSEYFDEAYFNAHKSEWLDGDVLKPEYDAAHMNIGGSWRMPTETEIRELLDGTTRSAETLDGVEGIRFTSKANGNSIFIPFCGYRLGSNVESVGYYGCVWSSSLNAGDANFSHSLNFNYYSVARISHSGRYYGFVVRGVHE